MKKEEGSFCDAMRASVSGHPGNPFDGEGRSPMFTKASPDCLISSMLFWNKCCTCCGLEGDPMVATAFTVSSCGAASKAVAPPMECPTIRPGAGNCLLKSGQLPAGPPHSLNSYFLKNHLD